jgi:two-component system chemotaxis response regulator CheB
MTSSKRRRDLVVIGGSAGGLEALLDLVAQLPAALPAAVLVVLHMPAGGTSKLARILDRAGPLPAVLPSDREHLEDGVIYVSTPDRHLMVADGHAVLGVGPSENGHRPAINALFRSAALRAGSSAIGVLLSGALDDGVAGLSAIAEHGGKTVVQSPDEAAVSSMPDNALRQVDVDHVLPAAQIGELLRKLTTEEVDENVNQPDRTLELEDYVARGEPPPGEGYRHIGAPSGFSCPDCSGSLADLGEDRFRCRVGHAWTSEALLDAHGAELERALWTALRTLDERTNLATKMADSRQSNVAGRYRRIAEETSEAAEILRKHLFTISAAAVAAQDRPDE